MLEPTLPVTPTKTYGPISVDLRDKRKNLFSIFSLSLSLSLSLFYLFSRPSLPVSSFLSLFDFLFFFFFFLIWIHGSHCAICPSLIQVHFCPETIYLFLVQFILNELSLSHFLTSEIFIKISSLTSLATYYPKNSDCLIIRRNFSGSLDFARRIYGAIHFVIQDLENFLGFPEPL